MFVARQAGLQSLQAVLGNVSNIATLVAAVQCGTGAANCVVAWERSKFLRFRVSVRGGLEKVLYVYSVPRSGHLLVLIFLISRFAWS